MNEPTLNFDIHKAMAKGAKLQYRIDQPVETTAEPINLQPVTQPPVTQPPINRPPVNQPPINQPPDIKVQPAPRFTSIVKTLNEYAVANNMNVKLSSGFRAQGGTLP